ncbi:YgaP-like transmembrane domain [Inhella proteolytica]|uniref:DUF2892 domain-containing protein n=1 Tax=Inhella proteolytica TaxID=2795029 RepID=A0A931J3W3_9BURK|nr:YgaP-like transmembrane domain [Inhella proteolytica]MBH9578288.1 DUF2892 domain-containing protein [Inhella proteolytica]
MSLFKSKLPRWERLLRGLAALMLLGLVPLASGPWLLLTLATAAILALTALAGFCPACALLGRCSLERRP